MTNIADWYPVLYAYEPTTEEEVDLAWLEEFKREREGNWEDEFEAEYEQRLAELNEVPEYLPSQEHRTIAGVPFIANKDYSGPRFEWIHGK